jgi:hypothetical protein
MLNMAEVGVFQRGELILGRTVLPQAAIEPWLSRALRNTEGGLVNDDELDRLFLSSHLVNNG